MAIHDVSFKQRFVNNLTENSLNVTFHPNKHLLVQSQKQKHWSDIFQDNKKDIRTI